MQQGFTLLGTRPSLCSIWPPPPSTFPSANRSPPHPAAPPPSVGVRPQPCIGPPEPPAPLLGPSPRPGAHPSSFLPCPQPCIGPPEPFFPAPNRASVRLNPRLPSSAPVLAQELIPHPFFPPLCLVICPRFDAEGFPPRAGDERKMVERPCVLPSILLFHCLARLRLLVGAQPLSSTFGHRPNKTAAVAAEVSARDDAYR